MSGNIDIFVIDQIGDGRLATSAHPAAAGDPATNIEAVAAAGFQQVVSLLEPAEAESLGLEREVRLVETRDMRFVSFPIADFSEPVSVSAFAALSQRIYRDLQAGRSTLVHCRGGVGRSGLLAVAVLIQGGMSVQDAISLVTRKRGKPSPETGQQSQWLETNAVRLRTRSEQATEGSI